MGKGESRIGFREGGCKFAFSDESPSYRKKTQFGCGDAVIEDLPIDKGMGIFGRPKKEAVIPARFYDEEDARLVHYVHQTPAHNVNGSAQYVRGLDYDEPADPFIFDGDEAPGGVYCIQGTRGGRVDVGDDLSLSSAESYVRVSVVYGHIHEKGTSFFAINDAGYEISGTIIRDKRTADFGTFDGVVIDHKYGDLETFYEPVGRNPQRHINKIATSGTGFLPPLTRNPPLVENIRVLYEFPDDYDIGTEAEEQEILSGGINQQKQYSTPEDYLEALNEVNRSAAKDPNDRTVKRYNVFNFDDRNKIIERIEGSAVDFYGNVIDLNRQPINIDFGEENKGNTTKENIVTKLNRLHRRGMVYHLSFNSRKENEEQDTINKFIYKDKSKWFVDVDKEGLTKINIPSSSKFGNIPVLTRYESNAVYTKDVDITIENLQFGVGDTSIYPAMLYELSTNITNNLSGKALVETIDDEQIVGITEKSGAYHNIITTAMRLMGDFSYDTKKGTASYALEPAISVDLERGMQGGRSIFSNLDGSLELYVGADENDKKSFVLDTAGAIINRIGRDLNGRSIMTQADGDVFLQIGGVGATDAQGEDERFEDNSELQEFRPGTFMLQVVTQNSSSKRRALAAPGITNSPTTVPLDQVIRITEDGMEVVLDGKLVLDISGDIELVSGANLNIRAPQILFQPGHAGQGAGPPARILLPSGAGLPIGSGPT